ncbi:hypothetical protein VTK56DRAFT_383 [Thermocarpiscus australiensis]
MGWDDLLQDSIEALSGARPAQWCQTFFLLAAGGVAAVAAMPRDAKALLVDYGARKSENPPAAGPAAKIPTSDRLLSLFATITSRTQVPHSWFGAFYAVSLAGSIFWLAQYLCDGAVLHWIASSQAPAQEQSATMGQVALGWIMMFLQAARRLFEHAAVFKPSKSTMWLVHWLLGLAFYLIIGVAIWVEGSGAVLGQTASHTSNVESALKMIVAVPAFLFAWVNQYRCHKHLAGLKKYSLPQEGLFHYYICPHYTCECLLYLSMAVGTAPRGALGNRTLLCALIFVGVNLGVTASGTRKWYAEKFGTSTVANRWNMIPFVF